MSLTDYGFEKPSKESKEFYKTLHDGIKDVSEYEYKASVLDRYDPVEAGRMRLMMKETLIGILRGYLRVEPEVRGRMQRVYDLGMESVARDEQGRHDESDNFFEDEWIAGGEGLEVGYDVFVADKYNVRKAFEAALYNLTRDDLSQRERDRLLRDAFLTLDHALDTWHTGGSAVEILSYLLTGDYTRGDKLREAFDYRTSPAAPTRWNLELRRDFGVPVPAWSGLTRRRSPQVHVRQHERRRR